ncbi:MAG: hypothetical protein RMN25_12485 [Anaerolineae bacterium]|nr:hypothetical protein [Thermoflexales bacterium]MDW8408588.1 hypothetical protein [Anaerolineae bacterium]
MEARVELLIWTTLSLILGVIGVNAAYRAQGGRLIQFAEHSIAGALLREIGLFIFMVGIPFSALISGASGIDLMGLGKDLAAPDNVLGFPFSDWMRGIGQAVPATLCALVVLWLAGRAAQGKEPWRIGALGVRDAFYNEVHWMFYRAAPTLWLGDPYWGAVIGVIPVVLEWVIHPDASFWVETIEGRQVLAVRLACVITSSFLCLATRNLWLMIAAHVTIQIVGSRLISHRSGQTSDQPNTSASP